MANVSGDNGPSMDEELSQRNLGLIVTETFFYILTVLVAFTGNTCVILAVYRNSRLRTIPNYYIVSLAISDILLPLLCAPYSMAVIILGYWPFNEKACQAQGFFVTILGCASLQILALTSINRFCRIVRPQRYRSVFTKRNTIIMIVLGCVLACIEPLPYLFTGRRYVFHPGKLFCFQTLEVSVPNFLVYPYLGVPAFTLIVCYAIVFIKMRAHQRTVRNLRSSSLTGDGITIADVKVTKILFVTVLGFLTCWTPIAAIESVDIFRGKDSFPRQVYVLYLFLGNLSSVFNPFVYGVLNRSFREEYKKLFSMRIRNSRVRRIQLPRDPGFTK